MQSVVSVLGEVATRRGTFCHTALDAVSQDIMSLFQNLAMAEQARHDEILETETTIVRHLQPKAGDPAFENLTQDETCWIPSASAENDNKLVVQTNRPDAFTPNDSNKNHCERSEHNCHPELDSGSIPFCQTSINRFRGSKHFSTCRYNSVPVSEMKKHGIVCIKFLSTNYLTHTGMRRKRGVPCLA